MRALLREKLFRKHYNKLLESRQQLSKKPSVNTLSSVTILAAAKNHSFEMIIRAPEYFRKMGMTCHIYIVKEKSETISTSEDIRIINADDCMWYGVPSQETLVKWLANKTDLLILSNPDRKPLLKYLCAASNSKLKSTLTYAGQENNDLDIDLWIDVADAHKVTLEEQCIFTYSTLTKIGIKPPIIG